jgi:hypothetical protein
MHLLHKHLQMICHTKDKLSLKAGQAAMSKPDAVLGGHIGTVWLSLLLSAEVPTVAVIDSATPTLTFHAAWNNKL